MMFVNGNELSVFPGTEDESAVLSLIRGSGISVPCRLIYGGTTRQGSVLKASSPNPDVKFQISPIADGRATVRATYQGKEKVYLIN